MSIYPPAKSEISKSQDGVSLRKVCFGVEANSSKLTQHANDLLDMHTAYEKSNKSEQIAKTQKKA